MIEIVYGSGGGNTELVVNAIKDYLEGAGGSVVVHKAKVSNFDSLGESKLYVLASPTYGHGQLEKYMGRFISSYKKCSFEIKDKKFAVIGLGDKKYDSDYFMESAKILEGFVDDNGGEVVEVLKIGGCVYKDFEKNLKEFSDKILSKLDE